MELKELTDKTCELFGIGSAENLGKALMAACSDEKILESFVELINGDLSQDWLQKIYQYYLSDRKEKKQDYTPACLAQLMGMLVGDSETVTDLCAGSGALIIQKWMQKPDTVFTAIELDETVIPFLLFNLVLRNIQCDVLRMDALTDEKPKQKWSVRKGERFGKIIDFKPAL